MNKTKNIDFNFIIKGVVVSGVIVVATECVKEIMTFAKELTAKYDLKNGILVRVTSKEECKKLSSR